MDTAGDISRDLTHRHSKVFQKVQQLAPLFTPTCAMADFDEASVAGFQHVYPNAGASNPAHHKIASERGTYGSDADFQNVVQCLVHESVAAAAERNRHRNR